MTIAAGFVAVDGILICTDSEYTSGVKTYGRKIFTHRFDSGSVISFAIAGHEPFAKRAVEDAIEFLDHNPDAQQTVMFIRAAVEQIVKATYENYVDTRPTEEREFSRFQLLIGIATPTEDAKLFSVTGPTLAPVETYECHGAGYYVGHHIIGAAYRPRMELEQIATLAIHALAVAKRYVPGVGGPSQFEFIRDRAITAPIHNQYRFYPYDVVGFVDGYLTAFDEDVAGLLFDLSNPQLSDEDFEPKLSEFITRVRSLRGEWRRSAEHSDLYRLIRDASSVE